MTRYRDAAVFAFLALAWGGSYTGIEVALEYLPPVLLSAVRYDVAAVLLLGYVALRGDPVPATRGDLTAVLATGGLVIGGGSVLLFVGQARTTGGVAALVFSLNPVLTAGFARALLPDERPTGTDLAGLAAGLAGVAAVIRPTPGALLRPDVVGKGLVLAAAASVALGSVLVRRTPTTRSSTAITAWGMAVGAAGMHATSAVLGEPVAAPTAPRFLLALGFISVVGAAGTYAGYFHLLGRIGAVRLNLVSYATPPVAVVAGALLLGERVAPTSLAGFLLIAAGFALLHGGEAAAALRHTG